VRALIVDDSKPSRSILARSLGALKFECSEAANGAEAIALLATSPRPDVITLNWQMPVMDGIETLRRLRADRTLRGVKVLMVSTESDPVRIEAALAAGADDFLSKPFTPQALGRKLVALGVCTSAEATPAGGRDPVRVLIVDDSVTVRSVLSATLGADPELRVVAAAASGQAALESIAAGPPDVVLLDVEMPGLDGIATLREIRRQHRSLPVLMFSSLTERGSRATLDALLAGANDYVAKPAVQSRDELEGRIREEVVAKIKALAARGGGQQRPAAVPPPVVRPAAAPVRAAIRGVVVAVSTGGPTALAEILPAFARGASVPVLIVQHMPAFFTAQLAERLTKLAGTAVREAVAGQPLGPGDVLLAPGGRHMEVAGDAGVARVRLTDDPPEHSCRPAADVLFRSAAKVWGSGTLGIVLTGMGRDGLYGSRAIVEAGGAVIAQDEFTSVVWGMPGEVVRAGLADAVLPLAQIGVETNLRLNRRGG
jgi:two-component system chemotaxis response regulator CheB